MERNDEILVKVEGLSKKFCKDLKTSLWYGVKDLLAGWKSSVEERQLREKEFWALKDINFELRRGECLGLIGHNGAGKSTLLKILNGLINPDVGKVTIKGRVGALIELGAGFNPILSGRENIYNNGAVLGFSRKEIDEKIEEIIDFAEIREFIDMPVQNYSSGMKVRLGFAIAAQMKPDVLLIDEVLAVGDLGFVLKCFKKIDELLPHTAIIFVSHNMPMVARICNELIVLKRGITSFKGSDVSEGLDLYYSFFSNEKTSLILDDGKIKFNYVEFVDAEKVSGLPQLNWNENLKLKFSFDIIDLDESPFFKIIITDKEKRPVGIFERTDKSNNPSISGNSINFIVCHEGLQLSKGVYSIDVAVFKKYNIDPILRINNIASFQIKHQDDVWSPFLLKAKYFSI